MTASFLALGYPSASAGLAHTAYSLRVKVDGGTAFELVLAFIIAARAQPRNAWLRRSLSIRVTALAAYMGMTVPIAVSCAPITRSSVSRAAEG